MMKIAIWAWEKGVGGHDRLAGRDVSTDGQCIRPDAGKRTHARALPRLITNDRLERISMRQLSIHDGLTTFIDRVDERIAQGQSRIDNAKAKGKNVTDLQAALDAFSDAVKRARPVFEGTSGIIASQQGFDWAGRETDTADAARTVIQLGEKYQDLWAILREPPKALRDAIQAFRLANPPVLSAAATPRVAE